ncbi:MAG: hypothetical protein WAN03_01060, partial [Candidatus Sulfotelmatobacter sp.]
MADDLRINGIAGDADSGVADNATRLGVPSSNSRAHMKQREVAGAASEISNQNEFVVVEHG